MLRSFSCLLAVLAVACVATEEDVAQDDAMLIGTCAKAKTTSALNLRKQPRADGERILTIDNDVTVDVLDLGGESGWAHVRVDDQEGYAKAAFLACSPSAKPEMRAVRGEPVIDGTIDDVWATAPATSFNTDWADTQTASKTTVRALWGASALYLLWEVEGTALNTDHSRPIETEREGLYKEDCVEIFLTPDPAQPKKYFEIELGPHGHYFDLAIDRKANTSDIRWSSGAKIRTTTDAATHKAIIEVALTSRDIVRALKPGAKLPINMFRMEGKGTRQYLAWSPTMTPRPNFHVPEAFGTLSLE